VRSVSRVGQIEIVIDTTLGEYDETANQRIVLRNLGLSVATDIRFSRSLDFDVPPGHFEDDQFDFLYPLGAPQLIRARDLNCALPAGSGSGSGGGSGYCSGGSAYPTDEYYGVGTFSNLMTCANAITFMETDPDYLLNADQGGPLTGGYNPDGIADCNQVPDGVTQDLSSSFIFQFDNIGPNQEVEL
jgi:hypothetical protein